MNNGGTSSIPNMHVSSDGAYFAPITYFSGIMLEKFIVCTSCI
jgi:hypothetical protein